jgi:hypothetical protein
LHACTETVQSSPEKPYLQCDLCPFRAGGRPPRGLFLCVCNIVSPSLVRLGSLSASKRGEAESKSRGKMTTHFTLNTGARIPSVGPRHLQRRARRRRRRARHRRQGLHFLFSRYFLFRACYMRMPSRTVILFSSGAPFCLCYWHAFWLNLCADLPATGWIPPHRLRATVQ